MAQLKQIIRTKGYPGERLIGNGFWAVTILSHHNSMTVQRTQTDTLYPQMRPVLRRAVETGAMSPFEFAMIDDWFITIKSNRQERGYGYLNTLTAVELVRADSLRTQIGLRSVTTRNRLIDVQQQTGMDFFLPAWPYRNAKLVVTEP